MENSKPLLKICNLSAFYNDVQVLFKVSLNICGGQIVSIVGINGSGKTTLLKAVAGLLRPVRGEVSFNREPIQTLPVHEVVRRGIVYVPEGMKVFPYMSVLENLEIGAYTSKDKKQELLPLLYEIFPVLADKRNRQAGTLSGGQKRMLTVARGLMSGARVLLLDDPFLGMAPKDVNRLCDTLRQIRRRGFTLFMAGQHVRRILNVATKAYLLEEGKITLSGSGDQLLGHPHLQESLFGVVAESGVVIP
jgi:branched-chain amino acid transport system ATP-binding protein